jgi:hypothetical protein
MTSLAIQSVKMQFVPETVSETLDSISISKKLIARQGFIAFSSRESFKLYLLALLLEVES